MLLGRLGAGGMGQVFLGKSPGRRLVAVKVIRAGLAEDPGFRARFAREVAAAGRVSGVFTAPVVDADPAAPLPWLVTAYVSGLTLAQAVDKYGPLPVDSVLALAAGLAEGLSAVHAAGVVHRDLKPSNVLLAADGPREIDFGISRAVDATQLTQTGAVIGSPAFMSPEQFEGVAEPASDVFSLGAVLAFAATGEGPFGHGAPPVLMYRVVHGTPRLDRLPGQATGPVFKVIIANGGSKMQEAVPVARMIIALAARNPGLLGVVGLDRSIEQVKQAIGLFNASGIPVVATTLSADGIGGTYPHNDHYYFQLSPSNITEAGLILRYIQEIVPRYFRQSRNEYYSAGQIQARRILIFQPSADPGDLFTSTLVSDLKREAPLFKGLPAPQVTQQLGTQLCGAATVDIYAGRHDRPSAGISQLDDFSEFLRIIEDDCHSADKPFIIADDGVSRFIADPAARDQSGLGEPEISYVTNGIALLNTGSRCLHTATAAAAQGSGEPFSSFCTTYAAIVQKLFNLPKVQGYGLDFLWTGERVGLAFDAADLFIDAETNFQSSHPAIGRAEIPGQFISDPWQGVTGLLDFTTDLHIANLPLAVVRIRISSPTATPTCGYLGRGQVFAPGPGTGPCPDGSD